MKAKEEKMKAKDEAKSLKLSKININENVVLSVMYCTQILKKGGNCKQKQYTGTLCLRHYNLQNKELKIPE